MKNTLTIGPSWFAHEKRAYANWHTATIRELLQNASARNLNATRIDFHVEEIKDSNRIICSDNGAGMSRDVLQNVFLVLGESSKGFGEVGGLGIARNLICFSANKYVISSSDYLVEGCGAAYEIKNKRSSFHKGCTFEIDVEQSNWVSHIKYIIDRSSLPQTVYINGDRYSNNLRRGKLVRQLSFGDVWVNKSAENSQLIVRAGGMYMFDHAISIKVQVIIEIDPDKAKECLTSNRDGLKWEYKKELDSFLGELAADTKSALKDKTRHFKKFVNKEVCFKSRPSEKIKIEDVSGEIVESKKWTEETVTKQILNSSGTTSDSTIISFGANPIDREVLPVYQTDPILASMMVLNESNDPKTVQLIKTFYMPEKWANRDATRYQLLRQWFAVCQIVMDELSNYTKQSFGFAVGWVFSDEEEGESTHAVHLHDEGVHYLLLNPITKDLKLKFSVNSKDDHYEMIVLACHEATHCLPDCQYHNESFSSLFTMLMIRVMKRRKEITDAIKASK